jgi:hypothetical protein
MRLFGRGKKEPKPPARPSVELPGGEEVERSTKATLLQGKQMMKGTLFLTNRRLLFEAAKGDAKWMVVPFAEVKSAGLFPWAGATMGAPRSLQQCLFVETDKGEQVWWDFNEREEQEWLPLVRARISSSTDSTDDEGDSER